MKWVIVLMLAQDLRAGGGTTVFDSGPNAYAQPAANLEPAQRPAFFVGNSFFNKNWVAAPASVAARDGLGPLYNARSCSACHLHDGRGRPRGGAGLVVRLLPADPIYGAQIQDRAVPGVAPEAAVQIAVEAVPGQYGDGTRYELQRPRVQLEHLAHGGLASATRLSPRLAPAVFGTGLLEAVPEATLRALADPDDRDGDGISGRLSRVRDPRTGRFAIGRFGWKAEASTLLHQTAAAFRADMGITSAQFPREESARAARRHPPEVSAPILDSVVTYLRTLAVPAARVPDPMGEALFARAGCSACHVPALTTAVPAALPELSGQTVHAFTDLLLHDMGAGLDDGASPEWRTPPLWGLGLLATVSGGTFLLHDGRARDVSEAILWHGGEATAAREAFRHMSAIERRALLAFVASL
jgi:CxxC motif-containing protein (DUF1111 family)